ncbi:MAG: LysR family transcriptional regulator [Caldithrix sp.]|nr:MAG: LysR family transcriptional regulator [Caldithrix sp.]
MEIRHLKLVKMVAEEGNLTGAGKKLFLSQSALSHQLREIEDKFGTPIFQRVNKKMVLTQVGNRILRTADTILCELEKVENDIRSVVSGDAGILRISTECYTCYHWLPGLLKSYIKHYPDVDLHIIAEATRRPMDFLREGKLEVAIVSCLTKPKDRGQFRFTELFTDELVVVANSEHRFASQKTVSANDFAQEHLICYTASTDVLDIFQRVLIPAGVTPKKTTKIQLTEAIIEMVKANLGITVMARWAIRPHMRSKKLVMVPVANHALARTWYAVTINERNQPRYIECFTRHLLEHPIA